MKPRMFFSGWIHWIRVIGFLIAGSLLLATGAWAQTPFQVNTTDDGVDADVTDGKCEIPPPAPPGTCTLRAAVMQANRMPGPGAIIMLPAGTYFLIRPPSLTDGDDNGDLNLDIPAGYIPGPTSIVGAGAATTIIDGKGQDREFYIAKDRTVGISGVSLVHGAGQLSGGGLLNEGTLTLMDAVISDNLATAGGGGILNYGGVLVATRVTVRANVDSGIWNNSHSTLSLNQCTISGNTGSGIVNYSSLSVTNTTITGNSTIFSGGGIANISDQYEDAIANIFSSTIAYNQADSDHDQVGDGGGIYNQPNGIVNLVNTIVAGNVGSQGHDDCAGIFALYGYNKVSPAGSCAAVPGSPGTATPLDSLDELGILRDNGGPTMTVALVPPSSLIDGAELCVGQNNVFLKTDQRGRPRPSSGQCDIGAFEYNEIFVGQFEAQ